MTWSEPEEGNAPTRFHYRNCWISDRVADWSPRAAGRRHTADRRADGLCRDRLGRTGVLRRIPGGASKTRVGGGPQHPDRYALGDTRRPGVDTAISQGIGRGAARPYPFAQHAHDDGDAATHAHHPHSFRDRCRSGRQRVGRELCTTGWQRHRFHHFGADDSRQVAGAAQRDCAARQAGRLPFQPGNGDLCRSLPEALQSRRCVLRRGGDRRACWRQVRV